MVLPSIDSPVVRTVGQSVREASYRLCHSLCVSTFISADVYLLLALSSDVIELLC